jgi:hypothetical protein
MKAKGCRRTAESKKPCNPQSAVLGQCNMKTISVPPDMETSTDQAKYAPYYALDVGTRIKLQLQRANIRYNYAANIFASYSQLVRDRYLRPMKLSQDPQLAVGRMNEAFTQEWGVRVDTVDQDEGRADINEMREWIANVGKGLDALLVSLPQYRRIHPTRESLSAYVYTPAYNKLAYKLDNITIERREDLNGYIAHPIRLADGSANPGLIHPYYVNDQGTMINKANGMLRNAIKHYRNAIRLFYGEISAMDRMKLTDPQREHMYIRGTKVPKGSYAMLRKEDVHYLTLVPLLFENQNWIDFPADETMFGDDDPDSPRYRALSTYIEMLERYSDRMRDDAARGKPRMDAEVAVENPAATVEKAATTQQRIQGLNVTIIDTPESDARRRDLIIAYLERM